MAPRPNLSVLPAIDREPAAVPAPDVREAARAVLPTRWGELDVVAFDGCDGRRLDDFALVKGDVADGAVVPVRLHSECVTGDVFRSLRCDCGDQLDIAMARLAESDRGIVLYMRQEGRGIGIGHKIAAYALQDRGMDTVEANLHLGFDDDLRDYRRAARMLLAMGVSRVELHTNNLRKVDGLREHGVEVVRRAPIVAVARVENRRYLATKRRRSGHLIP
jgi:GTP cyclohydrolase II